MATAALIRTTGSLMLVCVPKIRQYKARIENLTRTKTPV